MKGGRTRFRAAFVVGFRLSRRCVAEFSRPFAERKESKKDRERERFMNKRKFPNGAASERSGEKRAPSRLIKDASAVDRRKRRDGARRADGQNDAKEGKRWILTFSNGFARA